MQRAAAVLLCCLGGAAALPRRRPKLSLRGGSAAPPISLPTVAEAEAAHAWTATDTVQRFAARPDAGLSEAEVTRRREVAGRNVLVQAAKRTQWQMLLDQFDDRLVQILVGVAVLSAVLGMLDADDPTTLEGLEAACPFRANHPQGLYKLFVNEARNKVYMMSSPDKAYSAKASGEDMSSIHHQRRAMRA